MPGVNGHHIDKTDRSLAQTKQDLILTIVAALKARFPGEDKTSKQDRRDMAREVFGVPTAAELKALPLEVLQEGYRQLTQPRQAPPPPEADDGRDGGASRRPVGEGVEPLDDEQATEALLLQLERYADSQGMTPAWQGLSRATRPTAWKMAC